MLPRLKSGQTFQQKEAEWKSYLEKCKAEREERIAKMNSEQLKEHEEYVLRCGTLEEKEKIIYRGKTEEQIAQMKKEEEGRLEEISRRAREYEKNHKGEVSSDYEFLDDDYIVGHGRREDGKDKISNCEIYGDEY